MFEGELHSHKRVRLITVTALVILAFNNKTGGLLGGWEDCHQQRVL